MPSNVKVMALTATANALTRKVVISRLCMEDPFIIYVPPTKTNLFYAVAQKSSLNDIALQIADELIKHANKADRTIIYCRKYLEVATLNEQFQKILGTIILLFLWESQSLI